MGQWNPAEGDPAVGRAVERALRAVRAVTALSGLRVVLTLDQLAEYVGEHAEALDTGLQQGPVAATQVERVVQGAHIGYRHPDAAWTTLPSRIASAHEGAEFARWFAEWLSAADPDRRQAARAEAKAVAAVARATGKKALADRIDATFRRGRLQLLRGGEKGGEKARKSDSVAVAEKPVAVADVAEQHPDDAPATAEEAAKESTSPDTAPASTPAPPPASVSRLPAKTTAGILVGTAMLIVGTVAGVAVLSETGAVASGVPGRSATSSSTSSTSGGTGASSAASPVGSGSATVTGTGRATRPGGSGAATGDGTGSAAGGGGSPVAVVFTEPASGSNTGSGSGSGGSGGGGGGTATGTGGGSGGSAPATGQSSPSGAPTLAAPSTSPASSSPASSPATIAPSSTESTTGCVDLLGLLGICV
jgi:hypothetical protein